MISERNIKIIGERLRAAREAQGRSLDDIAASTRINLQFLEQLESGIGPKLPVTYIDAFVKDYAKEIGLDIDEFIEKPADIQPLNALSPGAPETVRVPPVEFTPPKQQFMFSLPHHIRLLLIITAVVVVGLIVTLFLISRTGPSETPAEMSFSDAVNREEMKFQDSSGFSNKMQENDTLILEATALETVWVKIIIDGKDTSEALYPPSATRRWIAEDSLVISIGNPEAVTFRLNGKDLGTLGAARRPLRNITISEKTLDRFLKRNEDR